MLGKTDPNNVWLVIPPSRYRPAVGWDRLTYMPLEGPTIAGTVIKDYGVEAYDLRVYPSDARLLLSSGAFPRFVCIAGTPDGYPFVRDFVCDIKQRAPGTITILGGCLATVSWRTVVERTEVDYCILGECEETLPRLLAAVEGDGRHVEHPSVAFRGCTHDPQPNYILQRGGVDPSSLVCPDYSMWRGSRNQPIPTTLPLSTQRGCMGSCHFCANPWRQQWKAFPPEVVAAHVQGVLAQQPDLRELWLNDPTFNMDAEHCDRVIPLLGELLGKKRGWSCTIRADTEWQGKWSDLFTRMKEAHCRAVFIGVESFEQRVLRANSKGTHIDVVKECLRAAQDAGIDVEGFLVLGLEGEESGSLNLTMRETFKDGGRCLFAPRVHYAVPYPGSELYRRYEEWETERQSKTGPAPAARQIEEQTLIRIASLRYDGSDDPFPLPHQEVPAQSLRSAMYWFTRRAVVERERREKGKQQQRNGLPCPLNDRLGVIGSDELDAWVTRRSAGIRPLLFPPPTTEARIEVCLRELLSDALGTWFTDVSRKAGDNPKLRIGRIIVHGHIPHLVWSRSEAFRPVDFFFGEICKECDSCIAHLGTNMAVVHPDEEPDSPFGLISPMWQGAMKGLIYGNKPPCWPESFLDIPSLPGGYNKCKFNEMQRPFGCWSVREVLALSRLRLRRWAVRKREIIRTPAASLRNEQDTMLLLGEQYLTDPANDNFVSVVYNARKAHELSRKEPVACAHDIHKALEHLQRYVETFASDEWRRIWAHQRRETDGDEDGSGSEHDRHAIHSRGGESRPAGAWPDSQWWKGQVYPWLDGELCALLGQGWRPPVQAMYGCRGLNGPLLVYFELQASTSAGKIALEQSVAGTRETPGQQLVPINGGALHDFCQRVLSTWGAAFREADGRWENSLALRSLFPREERSALLGTPEGVRLAIQSDAAGRCRAQAEPVRAADRIGDTTSERAESRDNQAAGGMLSDLRRVDLFYKRRVHEEEDRPAQLALSTMGEMWSFAFRDVIVPHYSEFQRFQQLLRDVPEYRDHLTHSIKVFILGNHILDRLEGSADESLKSLAHRLEYRLDAMQLPHDDVEVREHIREAKRVRTGQRSLHYQYLKQFDSRLTRYQWALASLMHDFALPAEKANELIGHLFQTFLGVSSSGDVGASGLRDVLEQEKSTYRAFLYGLLSKTHAGAGILGHEERLPLIGEIAYNRLSEDHGFLSAIYLFNQLFERANTEGPKWWRLKRGAPGKNAVASLILEAILGTRVGESVIGADGMSRQYEKFAESLVLEVLDAIFKHNAFAKEYRLLFDDDPSHRFPTGFFSASASIARSPIPGLLLLCDTLCDWGRLIYPDELKYHESPDSDAHNDTEVVRPECLVSSVSHDSAGPMITACYRWRVPAQYDMRDGEWCLSKIRRALRADMNPYSPGFRLWEGCSGCEERSIEDCRALLLLRRFWTRVVAPADSRANRLRFPDYEYTTKAGKREMLANPLNRVRLEVGFYGASVCSGDVGTGLTV